MNLLHSDPRATEHVGLDLVAEDSAVEVNHHVICGRSVVLSCIKRRELKLLGVCQRSLGLPIIYLYKWSTMFVKGILRPIPLTRLIYKNDTSTFDLIHFTNVVYFSSTTIQDDEANYELSIAHKSKVKRRESTSLRSPIVGYTASNMTCRTCLKKVVCNVITEYRILVVCWPVKEL